MSGLERVQAMPSPLLEPRSLTETMAPFRSPCAWRSMWQFTSTFLAFVTLDAVMYLSLQLSVWLALTLAIPAAGLMIRLFVIQHDCGHGSFFRSRRLNDSLGRLCSAISFMPYAFWRRQHASHRACFNNLDRRDPGIDLYSTCTTLREYLALPRARRVFFRASRNPVVTQLLLPPLVSCCSTACHLTRRSRGRRSAGAYT